MIENNHRTRYWRYKSAELLFVRPEPPVGFGFLSPGGSAASLLVRIISTLGCCSPGHLLYIELAVFLLDGYGLVVAAVVGANNKPLARGLLAHQIFLICGIEIHRHSVVFILLHGCEVNKAPMVAHLHLQVSLSCIADHDRRLRHHLVRVSVWVRPSLSLENRLKVKSKNTRLGSEHKIFRRPYQCVTCCNRFTNQNMSRTRHSICTKSAHETHNQKVKFKIFLRPDSQQ